MSEIIFTVTSTDGSHIFVSRHEGDLVGRGDGDIQKLDPKNDDQDFLDLLNFALDNNSPAVVIVDDDEENCRECLEELLSSKP